MLTVTVSTKNYLALLQQDGHEWTREGRQVPSGFTGWLNRAVMLFVGPIPKTQHNLT